MKYNLRVSTTFERQLRDLKQQERDRVWAVIKEIQGSPRAYKELGGRLAGTRSAKSGNLRILYTIDEGEKRVVLLFVVP